MSIAFSRASCASASLFILSVAAFGLSAPSLAANTEASDIATPAPTSADDPVQIIVSIPDQRMDVYRGLEKIKSTPISSGKAGHSTPTGIFSILEKRKRHFSNLYNNAPMPFMQRLTWSGIALHAGRIPGYPASHGCIRLPKDFARSLYDVTGRGIHVVVTKDQAAPLPISHPALFQPSAPLLPVAAELSEATAPDTTETLEVANLELRGSLPTAPAVAETIANLEAELERITTWRSRSDKPLRVLVTLRQGVDRTRDVQSILTELGYEPGPVDGAMGPKTARALASFQSDEGQTPSGIIDDDIVEMLHKVSGREEPANAHLYVRQGFKDVFDAPVRLSDEDRPLGTHVYTALDFESTNASVRWMAVTSQQKDNVTAADALDRLAVPEDVRTRIADRMTPGSSLIVTDQSFRRHTTLGTDFIVQTRY